MPCLHECACLHGTNLSTLHIMNSMYMVRFPSLHNIINYYNNVILCTIILILCTVTHYTVTTFELSNNFELLTSIL